MKWLHIRQNQDKDSSKFVCGLDMRLRLSFLR